jgi:copper chaperone
MSDTLQTQFNVGMTCNGCANAVNKILTKIEGVVFKIDADVPNKKVIVTHTEV